MASKNMIARGWKWFKDNFDIKSLEALLDAQVDGRENGSCLKKLTSSIESAPMQSGKQLSGSALAGVQL
jgi:hypothetical protein